MSIGQHTFWIVVDLHTRKAMTSDYDHRRAMQFTSAAYASDSCKVFAAQEHDKANANAGSFDTGRYIVVEVPA